MEKFLTQLSDRATITASPPAVSPTTSDVSEPGSTLKTPQSVKLTKTPTTQPATTEIVFTTPTSSPTPFVTPTITLTAQPTATPTLTALPTAESIGCIPAASVTTGDVGRIICVKGKVLRIQSAPNFFLIVLENPKDAFYFLSYDRKWDNLQENDCIFATGEIVQLGNNPVMILDYKVPIEYCP